MKELVRTKVGEFKIEDSIKISEIMQDESILETKIIPIEQFLVKKEEIKLSNTEIKPFLNGVKIKKNCRNGIYRMYTDKSEFIGIAKAENGIIKRDIILLDIDFWK